MEDVHLTIALDINDRTYVLSGAFSEQKTILGVKVDQLKDLIRTVVADENIIELIAPFLPETMEFRIIILKDQAQDVSSRKYIEFIAAWSESSFVRIIKGKDITFFQVYIGETITFNQLPLVGEYFKKDIGISGFELVYASKLPSGDKDLFTIRSEAEHFLSDKGTDGSFHLFINYNDGAGKQLFTYPKQRRAEKQKIDLPGAASDASPSGKSTVSLIKVNELLPEISMEEQLIKLSVSAMLTISKFSFEVIGLAIKIPFEAIAKPTFKNFIDKVSFDIKGLSLRYSSGPFSITGAFYSAIGKDRQEYNGLVTFKINKIEIVALGSYIKTSAYSSLFAFGYLGIPIPGHPAFELRGLALGFGLNRSFLMPNINEVARFPLIQIIKNNGLRADESVTTVFENLNKYIPPKENAYVVVIGIRFQSFKIIDTIALAAISVDEGLTINMLGLSTLAVPKAYNLELAFSLLLDFRSGVAIARGELTPDSYILFPGIRLMGGFAFGLWFSGAHAGDFVISIGGYHPRFKVPEHYPKDISRLGFNYSLSAGLVIYGKMYFALTPQCMMAGIEGCIHYKKSLAYDAKLITVQAALEVLFYFSADFIIYWKPFYYEAEIQVSIYASLSVHCRFLTLDLEFNLSAKLTIWGPDFSGKAYLKVAGYNVELAFGSADKIKPLLTIAEFTKAFIPEKVLSLNISRGVIKKIIDGDKEVLIVNPKDFVLEINSQIPLSNIESTIGEVEQIEHHSFGVTCDRGQHSKENFLNKLIITVSKDSGWCLQDVIRQSMPKALWNKGMLNSDEIMSGDGLMKDLTSGLKLGFLVLESDIITAESVSLYDTIEFHVQEACTSHNIVVNQVGDEFREKQSEMRQKVSAYGHALALLAAHEEIDISDLEEDIVSYKYTETIASYSIL